MKKVTLTIALVVLGAIISGFLLTAIGAAISMWAAP